MSRYFMYVAYDGSAYHGWQSQPNGTSVQEIVEKSLSTLLRCPVGVTAAGRTDAGVNATNMPVHFDYNGVLPIPSSAPCGTTAEQQLLYKMNRILPRDISVNKIVRVRDDAHARFSAVKRTYYYYVALKKNPFLAKYHLRLTFSVDFGIMNEAAAMLLGTHDFDCFAKAHPDVKTSICTVTRAQWVKISGDVWRLEISADRFLRNMVRAVVGTLLDIGRGKTKPSDLEDILASRNRSRAGESVDGNALFLEEVEYPADIFRIPDNEHQTLN